VKTGIDVWHLTLLLASVAGFCDTITFVTAGQIFSAHVTGNFIVFAYEVVTGSEARAWIKLLTLPVFIISVMAGGWIIGKGPNRYFLLLFESVVLISGGLIALGFKLGGAAGLQWPAYIVVMLVVFAMGLQNAFGKVFSKETHGPTTMMTGNVTQASLDIGALLRSKWKDVETRMSLKKLGVTIGGFLGGCLVGAVLGKQIGLTAVVLPGLALAYCHWATAQSHKIPAK
jgi:uncharacterized membrane protein YoaK (UPF0700 family)